jgi:hypothetical protein
MADHRCIGCSHSDILGRFLSPNSTDLCSWDLLLPPLFLSVDTKVQVVALWEQSWSPDFGVIFVPAAAAGDARRPATPPVPAAAVRLAALARLHPGRSDPVATFFFCRSAFLVSLLIDFAGVRRIHWR